MDDLVPYPHPVADRRVTPHTDRDFDPADRRRPGRVDRPGGHVTEVFEGGGEGFRCALRDPRQALVDPVELPGGRIQESVDHALDVRLEAGEGVLQRRLDLLPK